MEISLSRDTSNYTGISDALSKEKSNAKFIFPNSSNIQPSNVTVYELIEGYRSFNIIDILVDEYKAYKSIFARESGLRDQVSLRLAACVCYISFLTSSGVPEITYDTYRGKKILLKLYK